MLNGGGGLLTFAKRGVVSRIDGTAPSRVEEYCGALLEGQSSQHPCIGARTVNRKGGLFFAVYEKMGGVKSAWLILRDLSSYYSLTNTMHGDVYTLALVFLTPQVTGQSDFAVKYWEFIQTVHDLDMLFNEYDSAVSADPTSSNFFLSLAGRALFTTTLNPSHPRLARRSNFHTWICLQKAQLDSMRANGLYEKWLKSISIRDAELDPTGKPNLLVTKAAPTIATELAGSPPVGEFFTPRITLSDRKLGYRRLKKLIANEGLPADMVNQINAKANAFQCPRGCLDSGFSSEFGL